jgi:hypothetical protein
MNKGGEHNRKLADRRDAVGVIMKLPHLLIRFIIAKRSNIFDEYDWEQQPRGSLTMTWLHDRVLKSWWEQLSSIDDAIVAT